MKIDKLNINFNAADPAILEPGNEIIHCAGIISNSHRYAFMLQRIHKFSNRLVIKRSPFGDFLSGPTHFIDCKD